MMKKMIALLAALLMLFSVCLAEQAEKELLASWDLVTMTDADGKELEGEVPSFSVGIYNDGTGFYYTDEDAPSDGTVELLEDGFGITVADNYFEFKFDANTGMLTNEDPEDGSKNIFAPQSNAPAEINAENADAFQGTWRIIGVIQSGFYRDLTNEPNTTMTELFGDTDPMIVIEGDKITLPGGATGTVEFKDGALEATFGNTTFTICLDECNDITFPVNAAPLSAVYAAKQ